MVGDQHSIFSARKAQESYIARDCNLFARIIEALSDPIQVEHAWTANTHNSDMQRLAGVGMGIPTGPELSIGFQRYAWGDHTGNRETRQPTEKRAAIQTAPPKRSVIPPL